MLKEFIGDLHIHTCLSPCGEKEMTPGKIIEAAKNKGLNFIGISDHNSTENIFAVKRVGEKFGIKVLGGIEITSREEVHILAFFDEDWSLTKIQEIVYENLGNEKNDETLFGEQILVNEYDQIIGKNYRLLIGSTKLKIEEIVDTVYLLDGLVIASHVDRESFSIIGQLGFIPKDLKLDAVELSSKAVGGYRLSVSEHRKPKTDHRDLPVVSFSDAHRLEEIGSGVTTFIIEEPTISEIRKALLNQDGRKVEV